MNNTLHTPAPWKPDLVSLRIWANDGNIEIARTSSDVGIQEEEANTRLISAAPDLLSALENLMARCVKDAENYAPDGNEPIWAFISDASDAISKAKGRAK